MVEASRFAGFSPATHSLDNRIVVIPKATNDIDCLPLGVLCKQFEAEIPFIVTWNSDSITDVDIAVNALPERNGRGHGDRIQLNSTNGVVEGILRPDIQKELRMGSTESNIFLPLKLELSISFDGISGEKTEKTTQRAAIPTSGLLDEEKNLVKTTDKIYDQGVNIADRTVSVPLDKLRKLTRYYAYAASAGSEMDGNLSRAAAQDGIGGFTQPVEEAEEQTAWGENVVLTMAGPTIISLSG